MAKKNNNKVTSRPGLFGTTNHYDSKGKKIGESRPGFFGSTNHYDVKGKKIGSSQKGAFGRSVHYDNKGYKTGTSYSSVFGTDHYDAKGRSAGHTNRSGFGTRQSSFGDNGNFTMVDRDDRRSYQHAQENHRYQENTYQNNQTFTEHREPSNQSNMSCLQLLIIVAWWFTTTVTLINIGCLFFIGGLDVVGTVACGILSIIFFLRIRNWRKK